MTQTIDQRARELLARHGGLPKGAIAALTEALTREAESAAKVGDRDDTIRNMLNERKAYEARIEELELAHSIFMKAAMPWVHDKGNDTLRLYIAPDYSDGIYPHVFTLGDLRRATLTQGIKE